MKRDHTMLGVGFLSGYLVYNMVTHGVGGGDVLSLVGLGMIIGSRYGIFGKVPPATPAPVVLIDETMK